MKKIEYNSIGHENLKRVREISLTGGHTVKPIAAIDFLRAAEDWKLIREAIPCIYSPNGQLTIEIVIETDSIFDRRKKESIEQSDERISRAIQFSGLLITELCHVGQQLLRTAIDRLNLSLTEIAGIKDVAITIAKLDFSERVKVEHVAEAIQYHACRYESYLNLEKPYRVSIFGEWGNIGDIPQKLSASDAETLKKYIDSVTF